MKPDDILQLYEVSTKRTKETDIKTSKSNIYSYLESDVKYRAIFENSPEAILIMKMNGRITDVNNRVFDWLGFKPETIIGKSFKELTFLPKSSKAKIAIKLAQEITQDELPPYELEFIDITGNKHTGRVSVSLLNDTQSGEKRFLINISDITKDKEKEALIRKQRNQLKTIFSVSPDILILLDEHLRYQAVNPAFCEFMNLDEEDVLGKTDFDLFPLEEAGLYRQSDIIVLNTKKKWEQDCEITAPDGTKKWVYVIKAPILDENKAVTGILITIRDITERKKSELKVKQQKEFLDKLFEMSEVGLILLNENGRIERINNKALAMVGREYNQVINKHCKSFSFPCADSKCPLFMSSRKNKNAVSTVIRNDGREFHVLKTISSITIDNKPYYLESFIDITKRKNAEDSVTRLATTLLQERSLFNKGPVVIFKWKNEKGWPVEFTSTNSEDVFGYSVDEFTDETFRFENIIHKDDIMQVKEELENYCNNGTVSFTHKPYRIIKKNGEVVWISDHTTIIRDENGDVIQFQGYVFDITLLKKTEEELREHKNNLEELVMQRTKELKQTNLKLLEAKNKAEESDRLKSAFLANMSHEIRTPLNIIIGFGELLKEDVPDDIKEMYIENINKSGKHLLELINDIIDLSKHEAGLYSVNNSAFIIEDELDEFYEQFSKHKKCRDGKINLFIDKPFEDKRTIFSDKRMFKQIMLNLINNAIKFTDKGYVKFGYTIKSVDGKEYYEFFVEDTGVGIPENDLEIIFERFRQSNNTGSNINSGTGLGLAIVKENVKLLGGSISVESEQGKGSVFRFTIPV